MFLKFDMRQGALVTRQGLKNHSDMRHEHFLKSTRDKEIMLLQRHVTLTFFFKSTGDMGTPIKGPMCGT